MCQEGNLLNEAGAAMNLLIKMLSLPGTAKEIVKLVTTHFNPETSFIVRQFEFNKHIR